VTYGQHQFYQDKEMLSTYEHLGVADGNEALDVLGVGFDVELEERRGIAAEWMSAPSVVVSVPSRARGGLSVSALGVAAVVNCGERQRQNGRSAHCTKHASCMEDASHHSPVLRARTRTVTFAWPDSNLTYGMTSSNAGGFSANQVRNI